MGLIHIRPAKKNRRVIEKLMKGLTVKVMDETVAKTAIRAHTALVLKTPKKYTGQTRRSWIVYRLRPSHFIVSNTSKVMRYLEYGTRAHGPKRARALFVPLTRRAAMAGPRRASQSPSLRRGRDYVWTKRVRGIVARRIVRRHVPVVEADLLTNMRMAIQKILDA